MSDEENPENTKAENEMEDAAADGGEGGEESGEGGGGFNAKKLILFVVLPLFILAGVGGGLYFSGFLDPYLGGGEEQVEGEEKKEAAKDDDESGEKGAAAFVAIPTMIVNLNSTDGSSNFLRLTVQIELEDPADAAAIEAVMPRVIDQFQTYLRELRPQDLRGSAGLYRLQMELLWRVNQAASPVKVKDVLFQEILLQ